MNLVIPTFSWHSPAKTRPRRWQNTNCRTYFTLAVFSYQWTNTWQTAKVSKLWDTLLKKRSGHKNAEIYKQCISLPGLLLKKKRKYQTEQKNIFAIRILHFFSTSTVLSDRLGLGWHTRIRTTWHSLHRLFPSGMLLPPCPPSPCLAYQRCMPAPPGPGHSLRLSMQRTKPIHVEMARI